jgi:hypothetical protein
MNLIYKIALKICMGVRENIRGAERNLPDFFGLCPRCQKKFPEKLYKIVVDGGGRSDYEKFLLDSIFPTKLTEFPTKLTEFVPFIFIISQYFPTVKRILPDWLCLPNKLGGASAPSAPLPGTPMKICRYFAFIRSSSWLPADRTSLSKMKSILVVPKDRSSKY